MSDQVHWGERAQKGFLASGIDPADRKGHKNYYIDLLQKMALEKVLKFKRNETVLDFGCGSGRFSSWLASKVRKVVGLETTPEMIKLAEENRILNNVNNVEFMLYDGAQFPVFPYSFDIVLSVGVLQYMEVDRFKKTVFRLAQSLKEDGIFYLIEQVSDHPKIDRPSLKEYLNFFRASNMECLQYYPIRNGRWWLLYLIRYGLVPKSWFSKIARYELEKMRKEKGGIRFYQDFLFLLKKR